MPDSKSTAPSARQAGAANFIFNDGGRAAAGFRGKAGDCVCRAIAIAAERPYRMSLLLQHGCSIETIAHALSRNTDGSASGVIGAVVDKIREWR